MTQPNEINTQVKEQVTQIKTIQEQLERAQSEAEIERLLSRLDTRGRSPDIQNPEQITQIKDELSGFLSQTERSTRARAEVTRKNCRITLIKNSVKWNLGALISGILFVTIWKSTRWARKKS